MNIQRDPRQPVTIDTKPIQQDKNYFVYYLNLAYSRDKMEFSTGVKNTLAVQEITDINANLKISFDSPTNELINLTVGDTFNFPNQLENKMNIFTKVYITNTGVSTGYAKIIFAYNIEIHKLLRITSDIIQEGILQKTVTVGITATPIPATALTNRINLLIVNNSGATVWIGSSTVTVAGATQGVPIPNGGSLSFTVGQGVVLYGISVAPGVINILEGA